MTDKEVKLIIGALLHDVGKVIYRQGDDRRKHSQSGYDYLKDEVGIDSEEILHCVKYHHADALSKADIGEDDLAYLVYVADNIAAATDRRSSENGDVRFEKTMPLQSVFNVLNGNHQSYYYLPGMMEETSERIYPQKEKIPFEEFFYSRVKDQITDNLKGREWNADYINSLLEVLEATLSYVPSSTSTGELADVSLYDHVKLTAAFASCLYQYYQEKEQENYKDIIWKNTKEVYKEDCFMLFSMDISGIQDFIYTISTRKALRTLRARSFYLEILMEHMIDCLLEELNLSRANLLYSGGGHCYMIFPGTVKAQQIVDDYLERLKKWFLEEYQTALYVAGGYAVCNSETLKNEPNGSYAELFRKVGTMISERKVKRYQAKDILYLNSRRADDYTRECKVCRKIDKVDKEGVCSVCRKIEKLSNAVLYENFFLILKGEHRDALPLPGGYALIAEKKENIVKWMNQPEFKRVYAKNRRYTGKQLATKLWVGEYTQGQTFEELADSSEGIKRIGVLRADVDNLGQTFVSGFENAENNNRYVTISRTATLSRQLSLFFKLHINQILNNPEYTMDGKKKETGRNATIIYSGGDDVFLVGEWKDVIELAIDLKNKLKLYTQDTLTLSGGIGIYDDSYPIRAIAEEAGEQENVSKRLPGKNAVTILEDGEKHTEAGLNGKISDGTYKWDTFENEVIGEKYRVLSEYLENFEDNGNAFLYRMLELIRNQKEKINFARFVYLIARLEPGEQESTERKAMYSSFSEHMCKWIRSEQDCRQLKTAISLYVYVNRKGEE